MGPSEADSFQVQLGFMSLFIQKVGLATSPSHNSEASSGTAAHRLRPPSWEWLVTDSLDLLKRARKKGRENRGALCPFSTLPELPPTPAPPDGIFRGVSSAVHPGCGLSGSAGDQISSRR